MSHALNDFKDCGLWELSAGTHFSFLGNDYQSEAKRRCWYINVILIDLDLLPGFY